MNPDVAADLKELSTTLEGIEAVMDLDSLRAKITELETEAARPDLWDDVEHAQRVSSQLVHRQAELRKVTDLRQRVEDLEVLYELSEDENDASGAAEADEERGRLKKELEALEVRTLLSGEYDGREAMMTIRAEAGGVDAADFAEMLMRMYIRWAERHEYPVEVYDTSYAEEAGLKSATFRVNAPYAYGTLSVEQGTHRLVRISPFDNQGRRQTSFAGVEVVPVVEQTDHVDIDEKDLRVDVYRSSGPGGQGVNTTDSAVRLTHLPTGLVVTCQDERSQLKNKARAMAVLRARLYERERLRAQSETDQLRRSQIGSGERAEKIRTYNFPQNRVTAHRIGATLHNLPEVMEGAIEPLIDQLSIAAEREAEG